MNDLTGSQRLVMLYRQMSQGVVISPSSYASGQGIQRQSVYYQLKLLKRMGFPVVNIDHGEWAFGTYEDVSFDLFDLAYGTHRTAAQKLVTLYQDLVKGYDVSPTKYAKKLGVERQTVYRQLDLLSQTGIPVTNIPGKGWTLVDYVEYLYD